MTDVEVVGGKNASLGEMISQLAASGVRVPGGFATTAHAFRTFLGYGGLTERIRIRLEKLDVDDVRALAEAGTQIRAWIGDAPFPSGARGGRARGVRAPVRGRSRRPPSPCAPRPRRKTCPTPPSPASRRPSSTSSASTTCCTR
jgi:hypothetical protein